MSERNGLTSEVIGGDEAVVFVFRAALALLRRNLHDAAHELEPVVAEEEDFVERDDVAEKLLRANRLQRCSLDHRGRRPGGKAVANLEREVCEVGLLCPSPVQAPHVRLFRAEVVVDRLDVADQKGARRRLWFRANSE